jgi:hypothetical protein
MSIAQVTGSGLTSETPQGLFEINEAALQVQAAAHPEANIIFGTVIDESLGDEVRVTVIAAGFESAAPTQNELEPTDFRTPEERRVSSTPLSRRICSTAHWAVNSTKEIVSRSTFGRYACGDVAQARIGEESPDEGGEFL